MLLASNFSDNMKLVDMTPVFEKKDPLNENYWLESVLSALSKIFEKLMLKQIVGYLENIYSPYFYGFRKKFNTQQALLAVIENRGKVLVTKFLEELCWLIYSKHLCN